MSSLASSSSDAQPKNSDDDNNNSSTKVLDDLTKQLMEALDTNDIVPWKSCEEDDEKTANTPFGKQK